MLNLAVTALLGVALFVGGLFTQTPKPVEYDGFNPSESVLLGATNFPTSLDSLTNPGATDSVATVSHSGQHSNANDAIEALEAKLGVGASTAVSGTVLAGNGSGSSIWTTYATTTSLVSTNIVANGSSTLQNFTFVNATGTSATTTNSFSTIASSTNLYGTNINGFSLTSCTGTTFLQWSSGAFGCASPSSGLNTFSTTTSVNLATTTIRASELPNSSNLVIKFLSPRIVGSTIATTTADIWMAFNYDTDTARNAYAYSAILNTANSSENDIDHFRLIRAPAGGADFRVRYAEATLTNITGLPKFGTFTGFPSSTTTGATNLSISTLSRIGSYTWATSTKATSIDIWPSEQGVLFATGTVIQILGW